jgi:hypothetical protein
MRRKFMFKVSGAMGERHFEAHFTTYPEWAEQTARQLIDSWIDSLDKITGDICWQYWPQFDRRTRCWV